MLGETRLLRRCHQMFCYHINSYLRFLVLGYTLKTLKVS